MQRIRAVCSLYFVRNPLGQISFIRFNLSAAFYNNFAPIPFKSRYDSTLLTPYAKTVPKVVMDGDYNTIFRAAEEETNKKIEAAKAK